jgi:hypothetical protein
LRSGDNQPFVVEQMTDEAWEQLHEREPVFDWMPHISIDPIVAFG